MRDDFDMILALVDAGTSLDKPNRYRAEDGVRPRRAALHYIAAEVVVIATELLFGRGVNVRICNLWGSA